MGTKATRSSELSYHFRGDDWNSRLRIGQARAEDLLRNGG